MFSVCFQTDHAEYVCDDDDEITHRNDEREEDIEDVNKQRQQHERSNKAHDDSS